MASFDVPLEESLTYRHIYFYWPVMENLKCPKTSFFFLNWQNRNTDTIKHYLSSFSSVLLHLTKQLFPAYCCYRDESVAWQDWWTSALKDLIPMCNLRFLEPATVRHLEKMWNGSVLRSCHTLSACAMHIRPKTNQLELYMSCFWSDVILSNSVLLVLRRQQEPVFFCLIWMLHEERKSNKKDFKK